MTIKIGINGFGRIGKLVFRQAIEDPEIDIVHINDKMNADLMIHLMKYDSVHGRFAAEITKENGNLNINGKNILFTHFQEPVSIPWKKAVLNLSWNQAVNSRPGSSCGSILKQVLKK